VSLARRAKTLMREVLMSSGLLILQLFLCSISTSISNVPIGFPTNIVVQPELRPAIAQLWAGSPTFRAQCLKIGEHKRYRVAVVLEPSLSLSRTFRARCVLRAYTSGFVTARVMVPRNHLAEELIPHELEHVVEHIEGINVKQAAGRYGTGAYDAGGGQIETIRAMEAGRRARQELEAGRGAVALLTRR
jgi:hypothetical protein